MRHLRFRKRGRVWEKRKSSGMRKDTYTYSRGSLAFLCFNCFRWQILSRYSLTNIKLGGDYDFIGLDNYLRMFTGDADIINSVLVTLKYIFMTVPAKLIFALAVAMLLSMKIKGIRIFRTVYYLPSILGGSVAISALLAGHVP